MAREVTALAPWFGSNRMLAKYVGEAVGDRRWCGIPFAGGMCELRYIQANVLAVNDMHSHIINLACVVAHPDRCRDLMRRLMAMPFHPETLRQSQIFCRENEANTENLYDAAFHYFICVWMGRSALAGTDKEFEASLATRWTCSGGDSNVRYRTAIRALATWHRILKRASFTVMDGFAFLDEVKDLDTHAVYCDPPFPGPGDAYRHKFDEAAHVRLAQKLNSFQKTRVVLRYYDHPLIRSLYPDERWTWQVRTGRDQANGDKDDALLINKV